MSSVHLAVDGWTLIERPWSAEGLHLAEWLEAKQLPLLLAAWTWVEGQMATALRQKGLVRAAPYRGRQPLEAWIQVFRRAAS